MTFDHEEELHKISNDYKDARYMINVIYSEVHYYDNVVYWSVLQLMIQQHHTNLEKSLGVQYLKPAL